jgi:hypothetical protein
MVLAALAAGCGAGSGDPGVATLEGSTTAGASTTAPAETADLEEALLAFTACMREKGFDLPDPELDAAGNVKLVSYVAAAGAAISGPDDAAALREAARSCRGHLDGVALRFAAVDQTALQDRLLAYAGCMREHGFDMPDPDFDAGTEPGRGNPFPGLTAEVFRDPAFQDANEACQGIFAGIIPGRESAGGAG